ncbi:Nmad5 family putative nucleotide modification protein [Sulfurimonas sp. ST-25]|uniref:Nmad5 family putative nucleotide modification protein n=1 Tax=Sulfurimonas sp. ST-25 TaxID=3400151 RepID=UPI003A8454CD
MPRLTKEIKEVIVKKAVEMSPIFKEKEALKKRQYELYEKIRVHQLGGKEKAALAEKIESEFMEQTKDLPRSSIQSPFHKSNSIRVYYNGNSHYILGAKSNITVNQRFDPTGKWSTIIENYLYDVEANRNAILNLQESVFSLLISVNTTGQLLKAWPEAEELIPFDAMVKKNVPAIKTDELNTAIGLPSK